MQTNKQRVEKWKKMSTHSSSNSSSSSSNGGSNPCAIWMRYFLTFVLSFNLFHQNFFRLSINTYNCVSNSFVLFKCRNDFSLLRFFSRSRCFVWALLLVLNWKIVRDCSPCNHLRPLTHEIRMELNRSIVRWIYISVLLYQKLALLCG